MASLCVTLKLTISGKAHVIETVGFDYVQFERGVGLPEGAPRPSWEQAVRDPAVTDLWRLAWYAATRLELTALDLECWLRACTDVEAVSRPLDRRKLARSASTSSPARTRK